MQNTTMQGSSAPRYDENDTEPGGSRMSRATESAQQTLERATRAASEAAERLSERGREFIAMQGPALDKARSYIREHPLATIGVAIAIGLLLSRLTSRR